MTKAQEKDLMTIKYFISEGLRKDEITEKDVEMFFGHSERGLHKELLRVDENNERKCSPGFWALTRGKIWRGRFMEIYEEGIIDGSMPYSVILGLPPYGPRIPVEVKDFMKKELFQGRDAQLIDDLYEENLS